MADHVYPQDAGTGGHVSGSGDYDDAANFASAFAALGNTDFVVDGLDFTVTWATPTVSISAGKAVVTDDSATAAQEAETRSHGVAYIAEVDARADLALTAAATNYVYLDVQLGSDDAIAYEINTTDAPPAKPYLRLAEIDTANQTLKSYNYNPDGVFETVRTEQQRHLTNGTDATAMSFTLQNVERNTLPSDDWSNQRRILELYRQRFEGEPFEASSGGASNVHEKTVIAGTDMGESVAGGEMTVTNSTGAFANQVYGTHVQPLAPFFSQRLRVEAYSGTNGTAGHSSDVSVGLIKDASNFISFGYNVGADQLEYFQKIADTNTTTPLVSGLSSIGIDGTTPFELMAIWAGNRGGLLYKVDGEGGWTWAGSGEIGIGIDLHDRTEYTQWDSMYRFAVGDTHSATISDYQTFHSIGLGIRDPFVVTYKDGAPVIKDGRVYVALTAGSFQNRGWQLVCSLDPTTFNLQLESVLFAEAAADYISNYVASHIVYDEDEDEFIILWSGFGNGANDPRATAQEIWVSRTDVNVLRGVHHIPCEQSNIPNNAAAGNGGTHDANVVYDASAGAWRAIHNSGGVDEIAVSETTNDSLTGGWTTLDTYTDAVNQIEGGRIQRVNGSYVTAYADFSQADQMVWATYPNVSVGRTAINLDVTPNDDAPHPQVIPWPYGDKTRYYLLTFDQWEFATLGEGSAGSLWLYEATVDADGYEYPIRTFPRDW